MSSNYFVQGNFVLEKLLNGSIIVVAECASPEAAYAYIAAAREQAEYANFCEESYE
jgi:hypothetical protein